MINIEGPYSFKDVDGLVAPVYIYQPGGEKQTVGKVVVKRGMDFEVSLVEEHKDTEMAVFEVPMRFTYMNVPEGRLINWSANCLTRGVHSGRQEAIWTMPLLHAASVFLAIDIEALVSARIYNDAMQLAEHGTGYTKEWAERMREMAKVRCFELLTAKTAEIQEYYTSASWRNEVEMGIKLLQEDKLNERYKPLHSHDSLNLFCRILAQSCDYNVSKL